MSAEDNFGIGGYDRVMGPNGQAQYWATDLAGARDVLFAHYAHSYVAPAERFPRSAVTSDPKDRDVRQAPHSVEGIDFSTVDGFRAGVILGSGIGGLHEIETQVERLLHKGPDKVSAFTIPKLMLNAASGQISIEYGLRGPNYAVATACASATNAIGDAFKCIQYDEADVMITGGSEAAITPMGISGFANMRALSERNA
ncbi:MAG: beta-ketoacyl synthase N-terminal-like domain-containing protein, partial [Pirellulales bacterium]